MLNPSLDGLRKYGLLSHKQAKMEGMIISYSYSLGLNGRGLLEYYHNLSKFGCMKDFIQLVMEGVG